MFASKTITEHILRGAVGFGAFGAAVALSAAHPVLALAMAPIGLVALRGCPACWTLGLMQTVGAKLLGKKAGNACVDGSCQLKS
jgi:hypothetical protein